MNVLRAETQAEFLEEAQRGHGRSGRDGVVFRLTPVAVDAGGLKWQYMGPAAQYAMMFGEEKHEHEIGKARLRAV